MHLLKRQNCLINVMVKHFYEGTGKSLQQTQPKPERCVRHRDFLGKRRSQLPQHTPTGCLLSFPVEFRARAGNLALCFTLKLVGISRKINSCEAYGGPIVLGGRKSHESRARHAGVCLPRSTGLPPRLWNAAGDTFQRGVARGFWRVKSKRGWWAQGKFSFHGRAYLEKKKGKAVFLSPSACDMPPLKQRKRASSVLPLVPRGLGRRLGWRAAHSVTSQWRIWGVRGIWNTDIGEPPRLTPKSFVMFNTYFFKKLSISQHFNCKPIIVIVSSGESFGLRGIRVFVAKKYNRVIKWHLRIKRCP